MKVVTWNVNGVRAVAKKGFLDWVLNFSPDILCLQETKASYEQLPEELLIEGYNIYYSESKRRGYSGVAIYSKEEPLKITNLSNATFDDEGRGLVAYYKDFVLINCYFPNSQDKRARLDFKMEFLSFINDFLKDLVKQGYNIVLCGDVNIAHKPIDLEHPDANRNSPGYYIEETDWMDSFLSQDYLDVFRVFNKSPKQYTWWSYRTRARERNVGWRIDYFIINSHFLNYVKDCQILSNVFGSDHCPVLLEIKERFNA